MDTTDTLHGVDLTALTAVLFDCIADGVYVLDEHGRLVTMNKAAEALLGYRADELVARDMHDAIHYLNADGSRQPAGDCQLLTVLQSRVVVRSDDDVFVRADGTLLPVSYTSAPIVVDAHVRGAALVFRDITQQRRSAEERERLLRAEQESRSEAESLQARYRNVIEAMPVHVWTAAADGSLSFASQQLIEYVGKSEAAILAGGIDELAHPADGPAIRAAWDQSISHGTPLNVEARLLRGRDFKYLWHMIRALPCRDASGNIVEWIGTNADVDGEKRATEIRDAALALARIERERLLRVFNNAPAVMALYRGPEHSIALVNPMWERFVGKKGVVGKRLRDVFAELEGQGIFDIVDHVFTTGEMFQATEMRVDLDRSGTGALEETYWSFVMQQLPGDSPASTDVLVFAVEVTEQVRARDGRSG